MPIVVIIMPHMQRLSSNLVLHSSVLIPIYPRSNLMLNLGNAAYLPLHKRRNLPYSSFSCPRQIASFEAIH